MKKHIVCIVASMMLCLTACNASNAEQKRQEAYEAGVKAAQEKIQVEKPTGESSENKEKSVDSALGNDLRQNKKAQENYQAYAPEPSDKKEANGDAKVDEIKITFVIDRRTGLFHRPECEKVKDITQVNRQNFYSSKDDAAAQGWQPCPVCRP